MGFEIRLLIESPPRALTSLPAAHFLRERERYSRHDELAGVDLKEGEVYRSSDVQSFHNLVTHDGAGNKEAAELMMQATVAVFLLRCLEFKGFIAKAAAPGGLSDEQLFFAKLLHHFMRCAYFNTHETVVAEEESDDSAVKARRIGRATNPTLALINHSCDPNYRVVCLGV